MSDEMDDMMDEQDEEKERQPYVIDEEESEPIDFSELEKTNEETEEELGTDEMSARVRELKAQLEEERQKTEKEHNLYLRALADFNNYKRRHQEEYARHLELANQEFILKILPVIDNFERAAKAAEESEDFEALARGVDLVLKSLHDILEKEGVKPIEAVGQEVDPNLHEAMMRVDTDEYPENTVVEEFERGYMQKDQVIRPSRVKVATRGD
jgi:molecular chaperone GrpE